MVLINITSTIFYRYSLVFFTRNYYSVNDMFD